MRIVILFVTLCLFGCVGHSKAALPSSQTLSPSLGSQPVAVASQTGSPTSEAPAAKVEARAADAVNEDVEEDADDDSPSAEEGESHQTAPESCAQVRYTADLPDETLQQLWKSSPEKLGSISLGFVDEGRLINAEQLSPAEGFVVVSPDRAFGTAETLQYVVTAIQQVKAQHPTAPALRVNQISSQEGGFLRPHKSHQNGRDVDLAFYYPSAEPIRARERERYIDVALNWALIKAIVTSTDVQMILVDRRVQKVIYDYALKSGEDAAWLNSIFHDGKNSIVQHARRHRDHFHVRFYNARAQELGRRVAPMLAQRPEQNLLMHRVHQGDTLGAIANHYGASVDSLRKANHIKGSMLHLAQVLKVPLRGPCTHCPVPPPVVLPSRRLPPVAEPAQSAPTASETAKQPQAIATSGQP